MIRTYGLYLVILFFISCAGKKYANSERKYAAKAADYAKSYNTIPPEGQLATLEHSEKEWIATVNFGTRKPNYVIIHHTAQNSLDHTIYTFQNERVGASAHYVISRQGKIVQMVNELFRAHHAGVSKWGNDTDLNSSSIGIELDNNGTTDPWPDVQIKALLQLLNHLKIKYKIPQANFIGHMDVSPSRKIDPANFPWKILADEGYGYWYDDNLELPPDDFDIKVALRIIGYDVSNYESAIKGFKQHYIQRDTNSANLTKEDLMKLYAIYKKYL